MEILKDSKTQYAHEQDQLLQTILDLRFFNPWRHLTAYDDERSLRMDANLEIYLTSTCNQHCEYCYLVKHKELYPAEFNKPEIILKNLKILFNYVIANNFDIPCLDIFSGEIWGTQFGIDVLELIYQYVTHGMKIGYILIASNCSFVADQKSFHRIQKYINKFKDIGCNLVFSISVDGAIIDNIDRPRNNGLEYNDEFYDNLFAFAKMNEFCFHPMISAHNVKYWIDNYKWWEEKDKQYNLNIDNIMTLEVRDVGWTQENIQDYCNFLKFLMDKFLYEQCNGDIRLMGNAIVAARQADDDPNIHGYIPWAIGPCDSFTGCTISNHLTVRVGDLAICPCHRTAYNEYLYGYFNVENNRISGVHAVNPLMAVKILMCNIHTANPLCDKCPINYCCLRGCFGSQLETEKDPFFPIENICNFFKAKYAFIIKYYREKGIIDYYKTFSPNEPRAPEVIKILQLNDTLEAIENGLGRSS